MNEKTVSSKLVYDGKIIHVKFDEAQLDNGDIVPREKVEHIGGAAVAPMDADGCFYLVRQYRYGVSRETLEFPAGKKEVGEDGLTTVTREIAEEIGYEGEDFYYLGTNLPTPAYVSETIDMYFCRLGKQVGTHFDYDENIEMEKYTLDEIIQMIFEHKIEDSKTIIMAFMIKELMDKTIL